MFRRICRNFPGWGYTCRDIYETAVRAMTACDHAFNTSCFPTEYSRLSEEFNKISNNLTQEQLVQARIFPSLVWLCKGLDICHSRMKLVIRDYRAMGKLHILVAILPANLVFMSKMMATNYSHLRFCRSVGGIRCLFRALCKLSAGWLTVQHSELLHHVIQY